MIARHGIAAFLALSGVLAAPVAAETLLLRTPDIHGEHIVFAHAGDLFLANRDGSSPRRLTATPGEESDPVFSPDGSMVAYTGTYGDNADVYVIPAAGGQPIRLTWHPEDDTVRGWSPDGKAVLFASPRELTYERGGRLYEVALAGGLPKPLPMPIAWDGAYAPDGKMIAYQPFPSGYSGNAGWKQYRGGTTPPIWLFDMRSHEIERIPNEGVNDRHPMWVGGQVYFVSDRDGVLNLWAFDRATKQTRQLTRHRDFDIKSAAADDDAIIYELGGRLHLYDLASGASRTLAIELGADLPEARARWVEGAKFITDAGLAPDGSRAVFAARGEIVTVPAKSGSIRNLTRSSGAHDRSPLWSPEGNRIAWLSDSGGEYRLMIGPDDGLSPPRAIDLAGGPAYYNLLAWTPDGARLLYEDNHLNLYVLDIERGSSTKIDSHARRWPGGDFEASVSPDSAWVAYTKIGNNYLKSLHLFNLLQGTHITVGDGLAGIGAPAFSRDGKYLYFTASTNIGPATAWLDMSNQERPVRSGLYSVVLSAGDPTPLPFRSDEPDDKAADKGDDSAAPPPTRIDAAGLDGRIVALPVAERDYRELGIGKDGALYTLARRPEGTESDPPGSETEAVHTLWRFDPTERKETLFLEAVADMAMSADGARLLVGLPKKQWAILDSGAPQAETPKPLALGKMSLRIEPRAEWRQIFEEAWRIQRDFFYDPGLHGADWQAVHDKYSPLVDHVGSRTDLNHILVELVSELESGHSRAGGGDIEQGETVAVGLLGADYELADGRYRISRIHGGGQWNPYLGAPLAIPGLGIAAGSYILEIDGEPLVAADNIHARFEGKVGEQVILTVNDRPRVEGAHDIIVQPVKSERDLRRWTWIDDNRRKVDAISGGKVGYVYLPNTAGAGFTYFNRLFFSQVDRKAMIIDERGNGGGQAANYIVDVLTRTYLASWKDRDGMMFTTPVGAVFGPKVMLIDQFAGSGGDFLPYAFRHQGGGTLVGKRTWGGLIGIGVAPPLVDGGRVTAPYFRFIDAEGRYSIEDEGVSPDIEVEMTPKAVIAGSDPQLETAVRVVLEQLANHKPPTPAAAPPYPTKARN